MRSLQSILSLFCNEVNKFNFSRVAVLDSIYYLTINHFEIAFVCCCFICYVFVCFYFSFFFCLFFRGGGVKMLRYVCIRIAV